MAFTLTQAQIYGTEAEEVVNKRYHQTAILSITGLATDISLDLGNFGGTFWTAVMSADPGLSALKAFKDIQQRAQSFELVKGSSIAGKVQTDVSGYQTFVSNASAGGAASESLVVTGLLTSDTIAQVSQSTKGANNTALTGYESPNPSLAGHLTVQWTANPGAGAIVNILALRAAGSSSTIPVGSYTIQMDPTNTNIPSITFAAADAPTAYDLVLEWVLKAQQEPVELYR